MQISLEISATKHDVSGPKKVCGGVCWGGVGEGVGSLQLIFEIICCYFLEPRRFPKLEFP